MAVLNLQLLQTLKQHAIDPGVLEQYEFTIQKIKAVRRVFQLTTNDGVKALKNVTIPLGELLFMFSAMEHLYQSGFQKLARINLTGEGNPFVQAGQTSYFVTDWIRGREANYTSDRDLQAVVKTLAELHLHTRGFQPLPDSELKSALGKWPENFQWRSERLVEFMWETKGKRQKTKFDRLFLRAVDYFYQEALEAMEALQHTAYRELVDIAQQSTCFCHHDMAHHNVIIKDGQGFLIDFDYCLLDLRIHDLASLLIRTMKKNNWEIARAKKILNYYHQHAQLQQQEFAVMLAFIAFPQDFWQVAWTYYREDIGRTEKESISRLERIIKMNPERRKFIDSFAALC